jgi:hypothetical protein
MRIGSLGKYARVASYRNGLIVHWKVDRSQSDAVEALGLEE